MKKDTNLNISQFEYIVNIFANVGIEKLPISDYNTVLAHYVELFKKKYKYTIYVHIDDNIKLYNLIIIDDLTNEMVVNYHKIKHHSECSKYIYNMRMYMYYHLAKNYINWLVERRMSVIYEEDELEECGILSNILEIFKKTKEGEGNTPPKYLQDMYIDIVKEIERRNLQDVFFELYNKIYTYNLTTKHFINIIYQIFHEYDNIHIESGDYEQYLINKDINYKSRSVRFDSYVTSNYVIALLHLYITSEEYKNRFIKEKEDKLLRIRLQHIVDLLEYYNINIMYNDKSNIVDVISEIESHFPNINNFYINHELAIDCGDKPFHNYTITAIQYGKTVYSRNYYYDETSDIRYVKLISWLDFFNSNEFQPYSKW